MISKAVVFEKHRLPHQILPKLIINPLLFVFQSRFTVSGPVDFTASRMMERVHEGLDKVIKDPSLCS